MMGDVINSATGLRLLQPLPLEQQQNGVEERETAALHWSIQDFVHGYNTEGNMALYNALYH